MLTEIIIFLFDHPYISYLTLFILLVTLFAFDITKYKQSTYYKITHKPYYQIKGAIFDIFKDHRGAYGEYLIYNELKHLEKNGAKFLFNCYIPKNDGKTTEIDIILIHRNGLFVFESKNYSGWIFGSENEKNWTQTLPHGKKRVLKEHFLNPIIQNKTHINQLADYLEKDYSMHSIIVFSNRCTLKNINEEYNHSYVIHRSNLQKTLNKIMSATQPSLSSNEMDKIYEKLYPLTQVSDDIKKKHIENISSYAKK